MLAEEYALSKVAKINQKTRVTLMRWIARFKVKGVSRFIIQLEGKSKAKLNEEQQEKIREVIEKV